MKQIIKRLPTHLNLNPKHFILFIHAAVREETSLFLGEEGVVVARVRPTFQQGKTADLLKHIDVLLKKGAVPAIQLRGVVVLSGPGQFSFLRSGIIIANTFAWVLNIPIVDVYGDEFSSEREFIDLGLKKISKAKKKFLPIVPGYGKEPNITIPKKKV